MIKKEVTREKFANFLDWLSPEHEKAGEEYERLRFRLCTFFGQRRCGFADELADETINRVILKVSEEQSRKQDRILLWRRPECLSRMVAKTTNSSRHRRRGNRYPGS